MTRARWIAVAVCSLMIGASVGLLSLVLYRVIDQDDLLRFALITALVLLGAAPVIAAVLSGRASPFVAGAGGLALAIAATVAAAGIDQGGTGSFPLTMGVGVGGAIALNGPARTLWARLAVLALLAAYSLASGRLISAIFAYPLFGVADELVESLEGRRPDTPRERATTSSR